MLNIQARQEGNAAIVTIQGKVNFEVTAQLRDVIRDTVAQQQPRAWVRLGPTCCVLMWTSPKPRRLLTSSKPKVAKPAHSC